MEGEPVTNLNFEDVLADSDGRKLVETISVRYRGLRVRDFGFRGVLKYKPSISNS